MTTLLGPECGAVHDYCCRSYVLVNIGAALWVAGSLVAVLPGVVR